MALSLYWQPFCFSHFCQKTRQTSLTRYHRLGLKCLFRLVDSVSFLGRTWSRSSRSCGPCPSHQTRNPYQYHRNIIDLIALKENLCPLLCFIIKPLNSIKVLFILRSFQRISQRSLAYSVRPFCFFFEHHGTVFASWSASSASGSASCRSLIRRRMRRVRRGEWSLAKEQYYFKYHLVLCTKADSEIVWHLAFVV